MNTTGVIMASGEGSRMREISQKYGVPKHLLPIGNTNPVELTIIELKKTCNQIIIICSPEEVELFKSKILPLNSSVEIIGKNETGFAGDYKIAHKYAKNEHIILTVGDIIFSSGQLDKIIRDAQENSHKFTLSFDKDQVKKLDFRMVMASTNKKMLLEIIKINPESFWEMAKNMIIWFSKGKLRASWAETLFNLNTPEIYSSAKKYFEER